VSLTNQVYGLAKLPKEKLRAASTYHTALSAINDSEDFVGADLYSCAFRRNATIRGVGSYWPALLGKTFISLEQALGSVANAANSKLAPSDKRLAFRRFGVSASSE
jgi:hypothetical protein